VDLIDAAAKRANIALQWVWAPDGPEETLRKGKTDLWPVVVDLPERHDIFYVTEPWARLSYSILAPVSSSVKLPSDAAGRTVAVATEISTDSRMAKKHFPDVTVLSESGTQDVLAAVCTGQADLGLIRSSALTNLKQADCPTRSLHLIHTNQRRHVPVGRGCDAPKTGRPSRRRPAPGRHCRHGQRWLPGQY
jgi:ABC-type amino acid transport substrate-binding protein